MASACLNEDVLGDALPQVSRLVHGTDEAVWPLLERTMRGGHMSRIGLEDSLLLPSCEIATDNTALVRAAKALINPVLHKQLVTRNSQPVTRNTQHLTRSLEVLPI